MTFAFDADAALAEIRNRTLDPAKAAKAAKVPASEGPTLAGFATLAAPDPDIFEERAAIAEFDGGLSRADAEDAAARAQGFEDAAAFRAAIRADPN